MGRISLWKNEKLGLDFQWFDKHILEQFTYGGVDTYVHKYLGAENPKKIQAFFDRCFQT